MKKNAILFLLTLIVFSGCKKESSAPLPIKEKLPGVWKITSYVKDGVPNNPSGDFSNNFFMFYDNNCFSGRIGSGDEGYFYGNYSISEGKIILNFLAINWNNEDLEVNEISDTNLKFTTSYSNGGYPTNTVISLSKVKLPTTYRLQNATSASLGMVTFYYDTQIRDFSNHGTIPGRTYAIGKVFSNRDRITIGVIFEGHEYIVVHPFELWQGHENTLVMADTTTVLELQSNVKNLPGERLKLSANPQKISLKEANDKSN